MADVDSVIELDYTSPYKNTNIFSKGGKVFFGIFDPVDIKLDGDEVEVEVQDGEEGHLDLIADKAYGDRRLWRVIAQANKIDLPLRDVVPGMRLIVPKPSRVAAALQRTRPGSTVVRSQDGTGGF
jgi:FKBP-type peptidyl-prolyl cis-trans isomerase 2